MSEPDATSGPARSPAPLYLEDYDAEFELSGGRYPVSEAEILEFGRRFDPQPMHNDPVAAADGPFGGLVAPGVLTFAIRSALYNQLPGRPVLVAGLGVDRMDLPHPVRPGDVLSIRIQALESRRSRSRPDTGIVTLEQTVLNQDGDTVLSMASKMIVRARETAADTD